MTDYIREIKRKLRDDYGARVIGGTETDPCVEIPDGEYPMTIEGKLDNVLIKNGMIHCCRWPQQQTTCA